MDATLIDRIATNLRKGVLEYVVLGLLADRERYGLELVSVLTEQHLVGGEGSVYPLLSRMNEGGLVKSSEKRAPNGRSRRYYRITEKGRSHLEVFRDVWTRISTQVNDIMEAAT